MILGATLIEWNVNHRKESIVKVLQVKSFEGPGMIAEMRDTFAGLKTQGVRVPKVVAEGRWLYQGLGVDLMGESNVDVRLGSKAVKVEIEGAFKALRPIAGSVVKVYVVAEGDEISDADAAAYGDSDALSVLNERGRRPRAPKGEGEAKPKRKRKAA